jgi:hypothetical protein
MIDYGSSTKNLFHKLKILEMFSRHEKSDPDKKVADTGIGLRYINKNLYVQYFRTTMIQYMVYFVIRKSNRIHQWPSITTGIIRIWMSHSEDLLYLKSL